MTKVDEPIQTLLDSIDLSAAYLDKDCRIVSVNRHWVEFGLRNGSADPEYWIGRHYFDSIDYDACDDRLKAVIDGILAVASGTSNHFTQDYLCHSPTQERWFRLIACRVGGRGDFLLTHVDRTTTVVTNDLIRISRGLLQNT